jgi:hypothetical protein
MLGRMNKPNQLSRASLLSAFPYHHKYLYKPSPPCHSSIIPLSKALNSIAGAEWIFLTVPRDAWALKIQCRELLTSDIDRTIIAD